MDIKNILIFLIVFFLIMWLQHNDDKKFNKNNRLSLYDKVKIPLVSSLFVILFQNFNVDECVNIFSVMFVKPPLENISNINSIINKNVLDDIFIGPPDF